MKNATSHDLGFSLRETRVRKMDKRDIGIRERRGARRAAAHKSEWWRRNIATKDSILAGNGQRNNAESIEVGLATPFGFVVAMLSVRRGSNTSARLNVIFSRKTDPQILQPPLYPPLRFPPCSLSCSGSATAGRVHSAGTVFFFSLLLSQCLPSFYFLKLERLVAFNATRRKGARNYLRFIANIGFVALLGGTASALALAHSFSLPSLSFRR